MRSKTKRKRVNDTLKIMKSMKGLPYPLNTWLCEINKTLSKKNAYGSTKELAQAFRYIKNVLKVPLRREEKNIVFYSLESVSELEIQDG